MPTDEQLEYEIALARLDLENSIAELQEQLREKLDAGRIAHLAMVEVKKRARDVVAVKRLQASLFARRMIAEVRARPVTAGAVAAGVVAAIAGGILWQQRRRLA